MSQEKILLKKFNKLNHLKGVLISRCESDRNKIIEDIKDVVDDIELILNESKNDEEVIDGYRAVKEFTLEELGKFNGKDNMRAYVAIDGTIYDLTGSPFWKDGRHFGITAGEDLSEQFYSCHAKALDIVQKLRVVGVLKE